MRDDHTHHPCNGVLLCRTCHRYIHANPFEAREEGFIVARHTAFPGSVPVEAHFGTLLLRCDGGFGFSVEEGTSG